MNPSDLLRAQRLDLLIQQYEDNINILPGLAGNNRRHVLALQFVDSMRRIEFAHHIRRATISPERMNPATSFFDPLRAAVLHNNQGHTDEAWWLVFLATHFGKHEKDGWRLTRDIYGKLSQGGIWDWAAVSQNQSTFQAWLETHEHTLLGGDGISRRFSNHRKYESLKASSASGTGQIISSYILWIAPPRTHSEMIRQLHRTVGQDPKTVFKALFNSMNVVKRFGRLGKFDFLAMLGKLGIAPIEPGSAFLKNSTGPLAGARLLFGGSQNAKLSANILEAKVLEFGNHIGLGAQILEDGLCNWQKSPEVYVRFRG